LTITPAPRATTRRRLAVVIVVALVVVCAIGGAGWLTADPDALTPSTVAGPTSGARSSGSPSTAAGTGTPSPTGSTTSTATPGSSPRPAAADATSGPSAAGVPSATASPGTGPLGDGTYHVGTQIAAGRWSTGGVLNVALKVCSYSINGGPPSRTAVSAGLTTVTLHPGDLFVTSGCQPWRYT